MVSKVTTVILGDMKNKRRIFRRFGADAARKADAGSPCPAKSNECPASPRISAGKNRMFSEEIGLALARLAASSVSHRRPVDFVKPIGVPSMIPFLSALHTLAAQRGEGLRPELVRLMERSRSAAEISQPEGTEAAESTKRLPQQARAGA